MGNRIQARPNRFTWGNTRSCAASPKSVARQPRTWPSTPTWNATSCSSATTGRRARSRRAGPWRASAAPTSPRCHGIERIGGEAYLVVEYVPGRNLAEVRRDGPLDLAQVVRILAQLAEGVAAVHARGLIHRDIKPANVILRDDGTPRLVDFGLAAHLGGSRLRERSGSPPYMAPEQARAEWDRIDFRTDVFGLGGVLYKLLTDHEPHAGSTLNEILEHAKKADVTPPRRLDPTIPAPVEAVCLKALAAAPENRYTTALEFAAALRQAIEPTPVVTPTPAGIPAWVRWGLPAAVVACGLLALAVWLWPWGPETATTVDLTGTSKPAAGPLQAEIAVKQYKDMGDGRQALPIGTISETSLASDPPRLKDMVRVQVTLSPPAYSYLIALNPDGKAPALPPGRRYRPQLAARQAGFPRRPGRILRPDRRRGPPGVRGGGLRPAVARIRVVEDPGPRRPGVDCGGSRGPLDLRQCGTLRGQAGPRQASR